MSRTDPITDSEKQLLHAIGSHPEASTKQLLTYTGYKWERTMKRKLNQLKKRWILFGPVYDIDYSRLCTNPLHKLFCILETSQSYKTIIPYLRVIEPTLWIFPVMSNRKDVLNVGFVSSDDTAMINILNLLKDSDIITDYTVRVFSSKRMIENPNLFGDFNPPLDHLLDPCTVPDMSLGRHDTDWNECDVTILPYLEKGTKLIDILRRENKNYKRFTYEQIKYSRGKMVKHSLIEKKYSFYPFPPVQCVHFQLFFNPDEAAVIPRILHNFAGGERVYKEYAFFKEWGSSCTWGGIFCFSHPLFLRDLVYKLDQMSQIGEKEVYLKRSFPFERYFFSHFSKLKYFDFETQRLEYPYHLYEEKIKENIESELILPEESARLSLETAGWL